MGENTQKFQDAVQLILEQTPSKRKNFNIGEYQALKKVTHKIVYLLSCYSDIQATTIIRLHTEFNLGTRILARSIDELIKNICTNTLIEPLNVYPRNISEILE
jgi:hypothetical protein